MTRPIPGASNGVVKRGRYLAVVIEGDAKRRSLYRSALAQLNIDVIDSSAAAPGIELCIEHRPDLLLININLPDGDAFDVLARVQGLSYPLPVVLVSEPITDYTIRTRAMTLGVVAFATMPVHRREFELVVRTALPHLPARARSSALVVDGITFDFAASTAKRGRRSVKLPPEERRLANELALRTGEVVPYDEAGRSVFDDWEGRPAAARLNALRIVKHRLSKLLVQLGGPVILETVKVSSATGSDSGRAVIGGGYRFVSHT